MTTPAIQKAIEALRPFCLDLDILQPENGEPAPDDWIVTISIPAGDVRRAAATIAALKAEAAHIGWRPIAEALRDGTICDVWLEDATEDEKEFYCVPGTKRSTNWHWHNKRWRPYGGISTIATFIQPTHFMPLPPPPAREGGEG